ncbi:hypothetical protein Tco_1380977 [Tanacetum coccineum]
MDDPNITMEEYIKLEEEKARKRGKVFNWETAKHGKIWYDEDIHNLGSFKTEFSAIAFNDGVSSKKHYLVNPRLAFRSTINGIIRMEFIQECCGGQDMALPPHDQRHQYLRLQVFNFGGLPDLMAEGLSARMLMEHRDAQGVSLFTSRVWRRLFDIRGPLLRGVRRRRQFIVALVLHTGEEMESPGFARY